MIRCYLIGEHLGHSYSPFIHKKLAEYCDIPEYSYELMELAPDEVAQFIKKKEFDGLNVTIPYKKDVVPEMDILSQVSERIGSVNTVYFKDNKLVGENTDYFGFKSLLDVYGISKKKKKTMVLGSGGASLTVQKVLQDGNASEIKVISRSGSDNYFNIYENKDTQVIINTTPVGMYPKNGECIVDISRFKNCEAVVDIIYNPSRTWIMMDAENKGIKNVNGLYMLVAQAARSFEFFAGVSVSEEIIKKITHELEISMLNIVLIGMPGCGKTTVGKILAEKTNRKFIDTDELINERFGTSPAEIIRKSGVEFFRKIESEIIEEICKNSGTVIATGGGAVTIPENYRYMHQNSTIVFINRSIDRLATDDRPLSVDLNKLWLERKNMYYNFCDVETNGNLSPADVADSILNINSK